MTSRPDEHRDESAEPWLAEALDSALDGADAPAPRAEFRASLRERFVAGELEAPRGPAPRRAPIPMRLLAAAAAVALFVAGALVAVYRFGSPTPSRVELVESELAQLELDGAAVTDVRALAARLEAGASARTGDDSVRLRLDDVVLVELAARTELSFERWSNEDDGETVLVLASGSVRVLSGPGFEPRRWRVRAPDAEVSVVGTEFGVDVFPGFGTCVCCTRGAVDVRPSHREDSDRVLEGGMSFCFGSGDEPMLGDAKADHSADVTALRRYW